MIESYHDDYDGEPKPADKQAERIRDLEAANLALKEERNHFCSRLVDVLLKQALHETVEVRRRLLESESIPAELWEMRFK